jgi:hypothetical protein
MEELMHILPHVMRAVGREEAVCERLLQAAWNHVVGDFIAAHARPVRLRKGCLIVLTTDHTWKAQLERLSPDILTRINRLFGEDLVEAIEYRVERKGHPVRTSRSRGESSESEARSSRARAHHRERLLRELMPFAEKIADPDLRQAFLRAAIRCLERREEA